MTTKAKALMKCERCGHTGIVESVRVHVHTWLDGVPDVFHTDTEVSLFATTFRLCRICSPKLCGSISQAAIAWAHKETTK